MDSSILSLFLPPFLLDYFELKKHEQIEETLHLYFCERNEIPKEYSDLKLHSKGFHKELTIQDFPIRGLDVYLHVQRRRWIDIETKELIERDWNMVAKGTRMTEEFSSFLKEINRY